jgi:MoxR-like ATPase
VKTPLTEEMYETVAASRVSNKCVAFAGPAGTGKTETARDFASITGQHAIVVNVSDIMTTEIFRTLVLGAV